MSTELLAFKYTYFDCTPVDAEKTMTLFHDDVPCSSERITNNNEQEIVKWILSNAQCRRLMLSEITDTPSEAYKDSIPDNSFPKCIRPKGGDIDFVILEDDAPSKAVCVEFKKVKVRIDRDGQERINNLGGLNQLINQGNERQSQGFFKTYICAVALIDSHQYKTSNVLVRGMNCGEVNRFYNLDSIGGIHSDVGVILAEIAQPTGKSFNEMFGFGVCTLKAAVILEQPSRLTEDVETLFKCSNRGGARPVGRSKG